MDAMAPGDMMVFGRETGPASEIMARGECAPAHGPGFSVVEPQQRGGGGCAKYLRCGISRSGVVWEVKCGNTNCGCGLREIIIKTRFIGQVSPVESERRQPCGGDKEEALRGDHNCHAWIIDPRTSAPAMMASPRAPPRPMLEVLRRRIWSR